MDKERIIAKLREHQSELKSGGIERLLLFGSHARGTAVQNTSDVDLIADFDGSKRLTLFDKAGLEVELGELLNSRVDLSNGKAFLSFRNPLQSLRDILDAIASIKEFATAWISQVSGRIQRP